MDARKVKELMEIKERRRSLYILKRRVHENMREEKEMLENIDRLIDVLNAKIIEMEEI